MHKNPAVLNWYSFLKIRSSVTELIITLIILIITLSALTQFLLFIELREGIVLSDPLLRRIPAADVTWITFLLIYSGLSAAIIFLSLNPKLLVTAMQSYIIMVFFRMIMMFLLPLNAPDGIIPLKDPLVEMFGTGQLLNKDLFFSGHTATMFLLFLTADNKVIKIFFLLATIIIGVLVIIQHVHYTADVVAAPFFAYCSYRMASAFRSRINTEQRNKKAFTL